MMGATAGCDSIQYLHVHQYLVFDISYRDGLAVRAFRREPLIQHGFPSPQFFTGRMDALLDRAVNLLRTVSTVAAIAER